MSTSERPSPLLRQREQRLGEQLEARDLHRQLALARLHHRALDADPVAAVEAIEGIVVVFAQAPARDEELHRCRTGPESFANVSFPCRRSSRMRPATRTTWSVSVPGSRSSNSARSSRERAVAVEPDGVRVDAACPEVVEVGEPAGPFGGKVEPLAESSAPISEASPSLVVGHRTDRRGNGSLTAVWVPTTMRDRRRRAPRARP